MRYALTIRTPDGKEIRQEVDAPDAFRAAQLATLPSPRARVTAILPA